MENDLAQDNIRSLVVLAFGIPTLFDCFRKELDTAAEGNKVVHTSAFGPQQARLGFEAHFEGRADIPGLPGAFVDAGGVVEHTDLHT
jgi:hypothetical protein